MTDTGVLAMLFTFSMTTITLTETEAKLLMDALESSYQKPTTDANKPQKAMIENVIRQLLAQLP